MAWGVPDKGIFALALSFCSCYIGCLGPMQKKCCHFKNTLSLDEVPSSEIYDY